VLVHEINPSDRFIVICSDGVTEFLSSQQVVTAVDTQAGQERDPLKACKWIAEESVRLWLQCDDHTDDITIIVIFLEALGKPDSPVDPSPSPSPIAHPLLHPAMSYTSATGDWFSADFIKHAMGITTLQRGTRKKLKKKSAASLTLSISCRLSPATDYSQMLAEHQTKAALQRAMSSQQKARVVGAVRANMLLAELSDGIIDAMISCMEYRSYAVGELVFSVGDQGSYFYVLEKGSFAVYAPTRLGQTGSQDGGMQERQLEHVHTYTKTPWGTYPSFGEMTLMYEQPRPATVKALTKGGLWCLHRDVFHACKARAGQDGIAGSEDSAYVVPNVMDLPVKGNGLIASLEKAVSASVVFSQLRQDQRRVLFDLMEKMEVKAGSVVYTQGEPGHRFYIVDSGELQVLVAPQSGGDARVVHSYTRDREAGIWPSFGEQALLFCKPRGSTVRAHTDCELWVLHRKTFRSALSTMFSKNKG